MMLAHPQMDTLFDFSGDGINTLVIEAPSFFRQFLQDISLQVSGLEGKAVLSQNNMPITFSKFAEVLDSFLSFEISKKSLVSKLQARLEAEALSRAILYGEPLPIGLSDTMRNLDTLERLYKAAERFVLTGAMHLQAEKL